VVSIAVGEAARLRDEPRGRTRLNQRCGADVSPVDAHRARIDRVETRLRCAWGRVHAGACGAAGCWGRRLVCMGPQAGVGGAAGWCGWGCRLVWVGLQAGAYRRASQQKSLVAAKYNHTKCSHSRRTSARSSEVLPHPERPHTANFVPGARWRLSPRSTGGSCGR
jgi:hypothetical protein